MNKCKHAGKYLAKYPPRCGCKTCWIMYLAKTELDYRLAGKRASPQETNNILHDLAFGKFELNDTIRPDSRAKNHNRVRSPDKRAIDNIV